MELFLSASQNVILKTALFITLLHHERPIGHSARDYFVPYSVRRLTLAAK